MQKEKLKYLYIYIAALSICVALCVFTDVIWLNLLWLCKGAYSEFEYISLFVLGVTNSNNIITAKFFVCTIVPLQATILYSFVAWMLKRIKLKYYFFVFFVISLIGLTVWQTKTLSSININYSNLSNEKS